MGRNACTACSRGSHPYTHLSVCQRLGASSETQGLWLVPLLCPTSHAFLLFQQCGLTHQVHPTAPYSTLQHPTAPYSTLLLATYRALSRFYEELLEPLPCFTGADVCSLWLPQPIRHWSGLNISFCVRIISWKMETEAKVHLCSYVHESTQTRTHTYTGVHMCAHMQHTRRHVCTCIQRYRHSAHMHTHTCPYGTICIFAHIENIRKYLLNARTYK
jgi:hypothetical protein